MYVLQTNISKLYYFVNVVLLIFYFLSYISKQNLCKQNLRIDQFYLTLFRMGRGQIQLPLPFLHSPRSFFSVRVTTLIFSDFNLHSLRNFWPIFENAASTQTLLHLGWEKKHECQKLPKNESNKYGRQEEGLIMLGIFLCSKVLYHPGLLTCNASSQAFMAQEITRGYIDGNRTILSRVNVDIFFIHVSKIGGLFKRKINTKIN